MSIYFDNLDETKFEDILNNQCRFLQLDLEKTDQQGIYIEDTECNSCAKLIPFEKIENMLANGKFEHTKLLLINTYNGEKLAEVFKMSNLNFIIWFCFALENKKQIYLIRMMKLYQNAFCVSFYSNLLEGF